MKENKSKYEHSFKNVWENKDEGLKARIYDFNDDYKAFLDASKTERESVEEIVKRAQDMGFVDLEAFLENGGKPAFGDKFYVVNKKKAVCLVVMGENSLDKGFRSVGSHIDCPRLDLKNNPLYEEESLAYFKTHYYGGIKKYQWLATPLALHGTIVKKGGESFNISIGENEDEPVFFIADLLPHLDRNQGNTVVSKAFQAENLNVLVGSLLSDNEDVEGRIKEKIYEILQSEYGINALDLLSAEIEVVPAGKARDLGFDRSMIAAYGHDDRSCSYASMQAIFEVERPKYTAISAFYDKEEIGSEGVAGATSMFFERVLTELIAATLDMNTTVALQRSFSGAKFLSADVTAALDPNYPDTHDKHNAARLNKGVCISKYTGSGGKYGTNDANAEFLREVVDIFEANDIYWQVGELGKADQGGGGTIAAELAKYGADVLDCGVPLLCMHGTYEVAAKADVYMAYKAYHSFFKAY